MRAPLAETDALSEVVAWRRAAAAGAGLLRPSPSRLAALSMGGSSLRLAAVNLLFVVLSTLQVLIAGAVLGTTRRYESFLLAWMLPEWFLFGLGNVLQMHLTPALMEIAKREGEEGTRAAVSRVFLAILLTLGAAAALAAVLAPAIVGLFAGGLEPVARAETVRLFRWLLPAAVALGAIKLLATLHRVSHSLVLAALAQLATPVLVGALLLAAPRLGGWAFVLGFTAGAAVQLAVLLPAPVAWGHLRLERRLGHPLLADLARAAVPLLLATTGFRLLVLVDRTMAARLAPGDVAALRYAFLFLTAAQGVMVMPVLSVGYNRLAALAAARAHGSGNVVLLLLETLWLLTVPLTLAEVLLADPLVAALLARRAFGAEASLHTAAALAAYAPALPAAVGSFVALQAFLSRRRVALAAALSVLFPLASVPLKSALARAWGAPGVAFGTAVVMTVWLVVLLVPLLGKADAEARRRLLRILLAIAVAVVAVEALLARADRFLPGSAPARVAAGGAAVALTYAAVVAALAGRAVAGAWRDLARTRLGA